MMRKILIDPSTLHLPPSRWAGPAMHKWVRQLTLFGPDFLTVPEPEIWQCKDGLFMISDGVTRATRFAKFRPGQLMEMIVVSIVPGMDVSKYPLLGDHIP